MRIEGLYHLVTREAAKGPSYEIELRVAVDYVEHHYGDCGPIEYDLEDLEVLEVIEVGIHTDSAATLINGPMVEALLGSPFVLTEKETAEALHDVTDDAAEFYRKVQESRTRRRRWQPRPIEGRFRGWRG